jgi:polysaccharide export outer membrane protein
MDMMKVGQVWRRLCILLGLPLTGLLLAGCQTNTPDAGFSEVPGMQEPAASTAASPANRTALAANTGTSTNVDLSSEIVKVSDILLITFGDLPNPVAPFDQKVKDDGTITLLYNKVFQAAGKRAGDLEKEIREFYVPAYFINLTVTVRISGDTRFYYVDGEVKAPGQRPYTGPITVTKAITAAGGFTDFASKGRIRLTHPDGKQLKVNWRKVQDHPELDPPVFPNDKVYVPRRLF